MSKINWKEFEEKFPEAASYLYEQNKARKEKAKAEKKDKLGRANALCDKLKECISIGKGDWVIICQSDHCYLGHVEYVDVRGTDVVVKFEKPVWSSAANFGFTKFQSDTLILEPNRRVFAKTFHDDDIEKLFDIHKSAEETYNAYRNLCNDARTYTDTLKSKLTKVL